MQLNSLTYLLRFIVIGLILVLSACSTVRRDGPPSYNVDVSKIPDATPKSEKLSRIGNKSYQVFGRHYNVMSSSKNYHEVGVASWYGTKFHSQRTSSGERYNMLAMTAAHKTLPLPTYVQVTNLKNGKKIIVKVNDRGPFESNRIIDLSYVAAKKLGMLGHGTALVDVKAIDPLHYDRNISPRNTMGNNFQLAKNKIKNNINHFDQQQPATYFQVGAFKNRIYAERLKKHLHQYGTYPISIANTKNLYKVQIGPIRDVAAAQSISKRLKAEGLHTEKFTEA